MVLEVENLVREEVSLNIQSPKKSRNLYSELFMLPVNNTKRHIKCEKIMSYPKIKRVQEWLERQPVDENNMSKPSAPTTDCDASGEYTTESDERESDTSEGMADSVATCFQGGGSTSQATSTEVIGGSREPLVDNIKTEIDGVTPIEKVSVIMRTNRRNSDRPWSVSCLSQLTQSKSVSKSNDTVNNQGLANFSISESALNKLSIPAVEGHAKNGQQPIIQNSDSKNSLKKRKGKLRKRAAGVRKSESGSDGTPQTDFPVTKNLVKSESFSGQSNLSKDLNRALSQLQLPKPKHLVAGKITDSEEETNLMKPNFCLGALTTVIGPNTSNLGSLAALSTYNHDEKPEHDSTNTGTEEHSSFSEQAWDNYQEKYQSEPYSEGFDSDAARRLLEFGDDYRNFLDSQSDCCSSSLSAANNLDSFSPPQNRKFLQSSHSRSPSDAAGSSLEYSLRRRRAQEFQDQEKKRRNSNGSKKISSDGIYSLINY